ncbi:MAG: hypothetical protein KatS3mg073_0518 [Meiothermus sp.]|nr:MAG: hypothetical protein KatS3mg073_0518 [Meiothermus sp.]
MVPNLNIRPFEERDYPAIAAVLMPPPGPTKCTPKPGCASTISTPLRSGGGASWRRLSSRWWGWASTAQFEGMYHPQKFAAWITVKPAFRSQGIGKALYRRDHGSD